MIYKILLSSSLLISANYAIASNYSKNINIDKLSESEFQDLVKYLNNNSIPSNIIGNLNSGIIHIEKDKTVLLIPSVEESINKNPSEGDSIFQVIDLKTLEYEARGPATGITSG